MFQHHALSSYALACAVLSVVFLRELICIIIVIIIIIVINVYIYIYIYIVLVVVIIIMIIIMIMMIISIIIIVRRGSTPTRARPLARAADAITYI